MTGIRTAASKPVEKPKQPVASAYRLSLLDEVKVSVYGEPDLSVQQKIDGHGRVNIPLLGPYTIEGMRHGKRKRRWKKLLLKNAFS